MGPYKVLFSFYVDEKPIGWPALMPQHDFAGEFRPPPGTSPGLRTDLTDRLRESQCPS